MAYLNMHNITMIMPNCAVLAIGLSALKFCLAIQHTAVIRWPMNTRAALNDALKNKKTCTVNAGFFVNYQCTLSR
ncbi:hypothetical protein DLE54_01770 [Psychrobacter sp. YP14]|nr:hypothetical protein DLE54_01770 [Psychrobacter sp. YP14]